MSRIALLWRVSHIDCLFIVHPAQGDNKKLKEMPVRRFLRGPTL